MKRVPTAELLDTDSGKPSEIAASLGDLRRINRWFGGVSTTKAMLDQVAAKTGCASFSWLEVAAGSGYVPQTIQKRLRKQGTEITVTLLDRSRAHLNGASRAVVGDALALPFQDDSFDLVGSSQFVHHLDPGALIQSVDEALRVCRIAVLIHDVVRHPVHMALVYAGLPLFRSRLTWHDAPASVRQAYTVAEMEQMLRRTSASHVTIAKHFLYRMGAIAWKASLG